MFVFELFYIYFLNLSTVLFILFTIFVSQIYDMLKVRHGVMIVGEPMSAKTMVRKGGVALRAKVLPIPSWTPNDARMLVTRCELASPASEPPQCSSIANAATAARGTDLP